MRVFASTLVAFLFLVTHANAATLNGTTDGFVFRITRSNLDRVVPRPGSTDGDRYYSWVFTGPDGLEYNNPKLIVTGGTTVYFKIEFETVKNRDGQGIMLFELFGDGKQADTTIGDLNSAQLGLTGNHSTGCMSAKEARIASPDAFVPLNISMQPCILTWKVPNKMPPNLYQLVYQCDSHPEMKGVINILDNPNPETRPNGSYHTAHVLLPFLLTLLATLANKCL